LASLGCHTWGECRKLHSLISACFSLSERWKCQYSSAYVAAAIVRFVRLALQVVMENDGDLVDAVVLYHSESTALTWLVKSTNTISLYVFMRVCITVPRRKYQLRHVCVCVRMEQTDSHWTNVLEFEIVCFHKRLSTE
jgi:hypothetical protein